MSTITTIGANDVIANSRTDINTNFSNLNTDKIETSVLDTDTTLAANSDAKVATQKAVKTYILANINPTGPSWNEYAADAGSTDAYVISLSGVTSYVAGQTFKFKANTANTGAATLKVNSLAAITIKKDVSSDLETGDILANQLLIVTYDGTNFQLNSKQSGSFAKIEDVQIYTANDTWTKPTNAKSIKVIVKGGGGSGASGNARALSTNNNVLGGAGGGGGSLIIGHFEASELPSTVAITVGAQVAGGAAVVSSGTGNVLGNNGVDGNPSSFGTYLVANGGKKGTPQNGAGAGGNGGFAVGLGSSVASTSATAINGQGALGVNNNNGTSSEFGGGAGGDGSTGEPSAGFSGGSSVFGSGGGGGGGAGTTNGNAPTAGGAGGRVLSYSVAGGGGGGAAGDDADGTAGTAGGQTGHCSSGGGGGGASGRNAAGANSGGTGGAGGTPGGGGGGGGAAAGATGTTMTSGAGGIGGRGEIIVITYF